MLKIKIYNTGRTFQNVHEKPELWVLSEKLPLHYKIVSQLFKTFVRETRRICKKHLSEK